MSSNQVAFLLVASGLMITSSVMWKDWLLSKEKQSGNETTVQLSDLETRRLEIFSQALKQEPKLEDNYEAISDFKSTISRRLKQEDLLKINKEPIISGARAAEIIPAPKQNAKEIRIDGEFVINEVRFPQEYGGKYKLSVTRIEDDMTVLIDASPETLTPDEVLILKESGFAVRRVVMQINAKQLRNSIQSANLVSICWPQQ